MALIPKNLLIHSVSTSKFISEDIWGNKSYSPEILISNVRVELINKLSLSNTNRKVDLGALLIFDCTNSSPFNHSFNYEDVVIFEGTKFFVSTLKYLYDDKNLHHIEVGLSNWSLRQT